MQGAEIDTLNWIEFLRSFKWSKKDYISTLSKSNYNKLFFCSFPSKHNLLVDPANSRINRAESSPTGLFLCLPECRCPFRLQLHFHFKQVIVVAMPRGPAYKTFKAFLLILRPSNRGTTGWPLSQQLLDTAAPWIKCYNFFFDSTVNRSNWHFWEL